MTKTLSTYKKLCMEIPERGIYFKRALERINTEDEFEDFCRRRKINTSELQVEKTITETPVSQTPIQVPVNLLSADQQQKEPQEPEVKEKKSKEKKRTREKSTRPSKHQTAGNTVIINNSTGIVIGNVNTYCMPVKLVNGSTMPKKP